MDDLNLPQPDEFGTQSPIELLRLLCDAGFVYSNELGSSDACHVADTVLVGAMAPLTGGGGRNPVSPRLLRHFNVFSIHPFDTDTIQSIYSPLLDWHFNQGFENSLKRFSRVRSFDFDHIFLYPSIKLFVIFPTFLLHNFQYMYVHLE